MLLAKFHLPSPWSWLSQIHLINIDPFPFLYIAQLVLKPLSHHSILWHSSTIAWQTVCPILQIGIVIEIWDLCSLPAASINAFISLL